MKIEDVRRIARKLVESQRASMLLVDELMTMLERSSEHGAPPREEIVGDLELVEILSEADFYSGKLDRFLRMHASMAGRATGQQHCPCAECRKARDQAKAVAEGVA